MQISDIRIRIVKKDGKLKAVASIIIDNAFAVHDIKIIENNNKIILDFTGIQLFTTTFFSASIGYFVLKYSPKECKDRFILTNLSKAGTHAYQCSFENAEHCFFNSSLTGV